MFLTPSWKARLFHDRRLARTSVASLRIATRVEDMRGNGVTEDTPHDHVGSEMLPAQKASYRHRRCGPVGQQFHPRLGIFLRHHRGHRPGEHGMARWERSVKATRNSETPIASSFLGTFAAGDELHRSIDQESVG